MYVEFLFFLLNIITDNSDSFGTLTLWRKFSSFSNRVLQTFRSRSCVGNFADITICSTQIVIKFQISYVVFSPTLVIALMAGQQLRFACTHYTYAITRTRVRDRPRVRNSWNERMQGRLLLLVDLCPGPGNKWPPPRIKVSNCRHFPVRTVLKTNEF